MTSWPARMCTLQYICTAEPHALFAHGRLTCTGVHPVRVGDQSLRHQGRINSLAITSCSSTFLAVHLTALSVWSSTLCVLLFRLRTAKANIYEYTHVSRRAIANLLLNPNMSLGFWVNDNLLPFNCKSRVFGDVTQFNALYASDLPIVAA